MHRTAAQCTLVVMVQLGARMDSVLQMHRSVTTAAQLLHPWTVDTASARRIPPGAPCNLSALTAHRSCAWMERAKAPRCNACHPTTVSNAQKGYINVVMEAVLHPWWSAQ